MHDIKSSVYLTAVRTYLRNIRSRKFEPEILFLKNILSPGENCLHIGASDARHSYVMSGLIGSGHIYAFEPSSYSYHHLKLMVKLHRLKNISTYKYAISDSEGTVTLITPEKSTGHVGRSFAYITQDKSDCASRKDIKSHKTKKEEVKSTSIDQFVSKNCISKIDFIRCDTEGSEMLILNGGQETINKFKPNLLVEIHSHSLKDIFNCSAKEVAKFLFDLGYVMFREDFGKITKVKSVNEKENWKDYFFIHPKRTKNLPKGPFRTLMSG